MKPTARQQRDFLKRELKRESQSSWDWEADSRFAEFLGEKQIAKDLLHAARNVGLIYFAVTAWEMFEGPRIKRLRLRRMNELEQEGIVISEWRGTGPDGKTLYGVNRNRAYFLRSVLESARNEIALNNSIICKEEPMSETQTIDLHEIMQKCKRERLRAADLTYLPANSWGPWAESRTGYLVVECPGCGQKTATRIEYTDRFEETAFDCDGCGVTIHAEVEWETVRHIVNVQYKAIKRHRSKD